MTGMRKYVPATTPTATTLTGSIWDIQSEWCVCVCACMCGCVGVLILMLVHGYMEAIEDIGM